MRLVAEAAKKSQVGWLCVADAPAQAIWFETDGSDLVVVIGGDEQAVPGIEAAQSAELTLRSKDTGASVVGATVTVRRIDKQSEEWERVAKTLSPKRLNGVSEDLTAQWRASSELYRLSPISATAQLRDDGAYDQLRDNTAGTGRPIPFHLGKRTRRKQGA
jgi:hypothetical protein